VPELPDLTLYLEHLERLAGGQQLERLRIASPFLLRTVTPAPLEAEGKRLLRLRRIGKHLVLELEGGLFLALHLMIAGRLRWAERGARLPARIGLAAFDFPAGTLLITEAGSKRRAALRILRGEAALAALDQGGIEVLEADPARFRDALLSENHTLKRALTDPRLFSGIGNAYSDEILHRARLSPLQWTRRLSGEEVDRLYAASREILGGWIERLRRQCRDRFPEKVTAFREGMAVHGRYRKPCPACGSPVQRIVYAENECNYCPTCQTGGRLLADRALSRLLKHDWPRTLERLEEMRAALAPRP
jgi:formamidopyrimidine-DNA glycosylase